MIGAEGTDSCGMQRQIGDPAGATAEEAPLTPRGKRVPGAEINRKVTLEYTIYDPTFFFLINFPIWNRNNIIS